MEWFFIESVWEGKPLLIQRAFHSREEAEQAAMQEATAGSYRILSYPTRNKRVVWSMWKNSQTSGISPSPY